MLKIRPEQLSMFDDLAEEQFVDELTDYLCERNPAVLPRFPHSQRRQIVRIMIARGRIWGATWKSSLGLFADLMQSVAPNFDKHPQVRQVLEATVGMVDERLLDLPYYISGSVWEEIEVNRVDLYLYTAPTMDAATLLNRTVAALPIVLQGQTALQDSFDEAEASIKLAKNLGIGSLEDGPVVTAVARSLYGPALTNKTLYPWLSDIFTPSRRPRKRLDMLRLRIALDFGRRV